MKKTKSKLATLSAWYDLGRSRYWITDDEGKWINISDTDMRRELNVEGLSKCGPGKGLASEVDKAISDIQHSQNVSYAGPLAGYCSGVHTVCGKRILVTSDAVMIEPQPGAFPTISTIIRNLLGKNHLPGSDQSQYFFGWLKIAVEALRAGVRRPGQALVLAGPRNAGKNLVQDYIITPLLGGRTAKPYQAMIGDTTFNSDLFWGEHLLVQDEAPSTDIRARKNFGKKIKDVTVNEVQRLHGKHKDATVVTPFWRLSISLNDEPEDLLVLPPMDESLEDKMILLKVEAKPMPMPTGTPAERKAFTDKIHSELPMFLDFLLKWEIPTTPVDLRSPRFGIAHYHHPELLNAISELAPEQRLLNLIDTVLFTAGKSWNGTAEELERKLTEFSSAVRGEAKSLLSYNTACGTYLGRLSKKRNTRVTWKTKHGYRHWTITPPPAEPPSTGTAFDNAAPEEDPLAPQPAPFPSVSEAYILETRHNAGVLDRLEQAVASGTLSVLGVRLARPN